MTNIRFATVLAILYIFFSPPLYASCVDGDADSRLQTYCVVNSAQGQLVSLRTAQVVDYRLKQDGYERGLGLPGSVQQTTISPYATPIIDYSTNINVGNPNRPLVLGNLTFTGDETLLRKEGLVAGVGIGANGRRIYGEGKYVDYSLGASYAHSQEHDIGIGRTFANLHESVRSSVYE
jgi:hypothetical protein